MCKPSEMDSVVLQTFRSKRRFTFDQDTGRVMALPILIFSFQRGHVLNG